jgi:hypothetical protein
MVTQKKCEPGCACGRHSRSGNRGHAGRGARIDWNDPEAVRAYKRQKAAEAYAANPEPFREASRRQRVKNPRPGGRRADDSLRYLYGLTAERLAEMAVKQEGLCYLCDEPLDFGKKRGVHVDHDHNCCRGKRSCGTCIRGLACADCNTGVGLFGDDPDRMRKVADNLEAANRRVRSQQPAQALIPLAGDDAAAVTPRGEEMS